MVGIVHTPSVLAMRTVGEKNPAGRTRSPSVRTFVGNSRIGARFKGGNRPSVRTFVGAGWVGADFPAQFRGSVRTLVSTEGPYRPPK